LERLREEELGAEMLAEDLGDVLGERDVLEEEGTELNRKLKVETSRDKALQGKYNRLSTWKDRLERDQEPLVQQCDAAGEELYSSQSEANLRPPSRSALPADDASQIVNARCFWHAGMQL
jgi:hypothetical protein